MMEPHSFVNVGILAGWPFKTGIDSDNVTIVTRFLDPVIWVIPESALFAHKVHDFHTWNFIWSISDLDSLGNSAIYIR
jgi:hypothetical protein